MPDLTVPLPLGESLGTAAFIMLVVMAGLFALWGFVRLFSLLMGALNRTKK